MEQDVILFDGDCAFCNGWVRWITKRDPHRHFRFIALGSTEGILLRKSHGVPDSIDSIVLIKGKDTFTRSDAAWRVLSELPSWGFAARMVRVIPRPLRNWGYDLIARNRHRLGLKDECDLPS